MPLDIKAIIAEMDAILAQWRELRRSSGFGDFSDLDEFQIAAMISTLAAAVDRYAPPGSRYLKLQESSLNAHGLTDANALAPLAGILNSLRDDVSAGRMTTVTELLHAEVFGDFLDMAQHLVEEGYKDPAAVLVGGVLEEHLRKLCGKHGLSTMKEKGPKKADTMNAELATVPAYSTIDQKNVTAWLGVRNDAAHGNYEKYLKGQVVLLVQGVRDFITRVPA